MPAEIISKTILNKTKRRDPWFLDDYTVNPYSGCSFNCLFCYIRGSKYGINMEEKLSVKKNAAELLDRQLYNRGKKRQYGIIVLSSSTDPYLQFEEKEKLTRTLLQIILKHRFPVHIITRSPLVLRDLDLLEQINRSSVLPHDLAGVLSHKALVTFSFSTIEDSMASVFEPGAPAPSNRLEALKKTSEKGICTGVSMMPLLPFLTDTKEEMEKMILTFKSHGAKYIFPSSLALYGSETSDSKTLVIRAIEKHYPQLIENYRKLYFFHPSAIETYHKKVYREARELCSKHSIPVSIT